MPNFSKMLNMKELVVSDSPKLTEVPGLDKSLSSMTLINMRKCTNLSAHLRKNVLRGWTSCGFDGIFLHGNYVPDWFEFVNEGTKVTFNIPPSDGHNFEGLTLFCLRRSYVSSHLAIIVINNIQRTELQAYIGREASDYHPNGDDYLLQGQLSNSKLNLQGGDKVDILFENPAISITRTGVNLVWDKPMKENMYDLDKAGYVFDTHPTRFYDEGGPSHEASDNNRPRKQMRITIDD
ncbi:uncharacterized protein [Malus domestica]|uniref:uncharacterized protein n=1 Tax=Malus domestica TaxID=3750 RepID=UPI0039753159